MKHCLVLGSLLLLFSGPLLAGTCLPGTLADYILLGSTGCTVSGVQFQDFFVADGQNFATPIDPAQIQVTPGGSIYSPTLLLTFNSTANAGDLLESIFHYSAASNTLLSAGIALGSPEVVQDGAVTGVLDVCAGGFFLGVEPVGCSGLPDTAIAFATGFDSQLSSQVSFPATSFFDVFVDVTIDGGLSGSAFLESSSVTVTTPEPSSGQLLLTLSVACLGVRKLRRSRRH